MGKQTNACHDNMQFCKIKYCIHYDCTYYSQFIYLMVLLCLNFTFVHAENLSTRYTLLWSFLNSTSDCG